MNDRFRPGWYRHWLTHILRCRNIRNKKFIDDSIKHFKKLEGKAGAAFASSGDLGGGAETAILDILRAFLVHGMVLYRAASPGGTTALFPPDLRMRSARKYAKILVPGSQGSSSA